MGVTLEKTLPELWRSDGSRYRKHHGGKGKGAADSLETDDIRVLELSQVFDVRLLLLSHLLDGHLLGAELAKEDGSLRAAAEPLQLRDLLKRNLPHV